MARTEDFFFECFLVDLARSLELIKPGKKWKTKTWFKLRGVFNHPETKKKIYFKEVLFKKKSVVFKQEDSMMSIELKMPPISRIRYEINP